eukprot:m.28248 g.28248  ORF g.28248 m.28248 type:complete len:185 (-) comp9453_c0_seq1:18-572(-)
MTRRINSLENVEGLNVLSEQEGVRLWLGVEEMGTGRLIISDVDIVWWDASSSIGYAINYEDLMMHAISRNTEGFEFPCIYMQLDCDEEEEEENNSSEGRLVLPNADELESVYEAMCQGQELNSTAEEGEDSGNPFSSLEGDGWVFSSSLMGQQNGDSTVQTIGNDGVGENEEEEDEEGMFGDAD